MKRNWASELRAIADGRLMLNVRNGVTVSRSMLAMIADEIDAERAAHAETKRERDEALKALEPFAAEANQWSDSVPDEHRSLCTEPGSDAAIFGSETVFTLGHLRAARRVREGGEADG